MDGGGRLNNGFVGRVIEREEGTGEWSSRVDYALVKNAEQDGSVEIFDGTYFGFDIRFLPRQVIHHTRTIQLPRRILMQFDNLSVVCNNSAVFYGSHDESYVHP